MPIIFGISLLTWLGYLPTALSMINAAITIAKTPAFHTVSSGVVSIGTAIAAGIAVHTATNAHAKADANAKKIDDATKPGH